MDQKKPAPPPPFSTRFPCCPQVADPCHFGEDDSGLSQHKICFFTITTITDNGLVLGGGIRLDCVPGLGVSWNDDDDTWYFLSQYYD